MFAEYMTEQAQEPFGHPLDAMPFHLRMMECILDETSNFFYQKAERWSSFSSPFCKIPFLFQIFEFSISLE